MSNDEMRMMGDSPHGKHFKIAKYGGFIDVEIKSPPNDYEGRHRLGGHPRVSGPKATAEQVWLGCRTCVIGLGGLPDGRLVIKSN